MVVIVFNFFFTAISSHVINLMKDDGGPISNVTVTALLISAMLLGTAKTANCTNVTDTVTVNSIVYVITTVSNSASRSLGSNCVLKTAPGGRRVNRVVNIIMSTLTVNNALCVLSTT